MVQQIVLNFDATGFEGFETCREYFAHCTRTLKDEKGMPVKQHYQAADMEMSPAQWSQKLNESNNTTVTINDAEEYTDRFNDVRWINFLVHKHIIEKQRGVDEMVKLRDQLNAQIQKAQKSTKR